MNAENEIRHNATFAGFWFGVILTSAIWALFVFL